MPGFKVTCCSSVDLPAEYLKKREVEYLPLNYTLGNTSYKDDLGQSLSYDSMYTLMASGAETHTSQASVGEYVEFFMPFVEDGQDVLHVCLSSGLSGTSAAAKEAAEMLSASGRPGCVYVVDSLGASSGSGMLVDAICDMRDAGLDVESAYRWALEHRLNIHHWFCSTDLTYYVRGGRISKAAGLVGTALRICPLLNMDYKGELAPRKKIRSKKAAYRQMVEQMEVHADGGLDYNKKCWMCHSARPEEAKAIAEVIEEKFKKLPEPVMINDIGSSIGCHSGPGTIAVFFWGDERAD